MIGSWKPDKSQMTVTPAGAVCLFLLTAILWVYWPVTDHGFINLDDPDYVTDNRHVRSGLTRENLIWAISATHSGNWHPLTWMSHMLDVEIFGLNPGGHHLTNLLFHLVNSLLLFSVFRKMTGDLWQSAAVASLFACHPLHVESVAWVAERKDLLSTLFFLLTLRSYIGFARRPTVFRYLPVLILFACGLMAKSMLVTLPFVLLLLDIWPLGRFRAEPAERYRIGPAAIRLVGEKVPLILLSGAAGMITFTAQREAGAVGPLSVHTLVHRVGNALVSYLGYIEKTVWPAKLGVFYPHPGVLPWWQIGGALLLLSAASVLILRSAGKRPFLGVGWLWYLGTLVPVIGLVQVGAQSMADRYTYIPSIGLFVMAAWGIPEFVIRWRHKKAVIGLTSGAVLLALMATARMQIGFWKDEIPLYERTLAITENNYIILNSLGLALAAQGRTEDAIRRYRQALDIDPAFVEAINNLGSAVLNEGRPSRAVAFFREALAINPEFALAHFNLGRAMEELGRTREAVDAYRDALHIDPDFVQAHNSVGNMLAKAGRLPDAMRHYRAAIRIDPQNGEFCYNLAVILEKQGRSAEAARNYRRSLQATPTLKQAHNNLGNILLRQGRIWEAAEHYHEAIRIDPLYGEAQYNMGVALEKLGRIKEAFIYYGEALRIDPDFFGAHINLGGLFLSIGNASSAISHFEAAVRLMPDDANARRNLEIALAVLEKQQEKK